MSIAARHLETRRPRKDRDVTWSRRSSPDSRQITWTFWRRDQRRAIHCETLTFDESTIFECVGMPLLGTVASAIRSTKRILRDRVDEIDLAVMEKIA